MLNHEALFINGVYETVLQEILAIQSVLPEHIMYLQPYSPHAITKLQADPPTTDRPIRLYLSTTDQLSIVSYQADIVGWEDKRTLSPHKRDVLNKVIHALQPGESAVYNAARAEGGVSVNLLAIRRLEKREHPLSVTKLVKTRDGQPVSDNRATAGGWAYVHVQPR